MIEKREWKHMTELIIKYYGDISRVTELASDVTLLLCGYAIITIEEEDIVELTNIPEVIFVEYPRRIFEEAYGDYVLCQNPIQNRLGLYGEGTIVAIIDTGVETTNKVFGERAIQLDTSGNIYRETPSGILSFQHGTAVASIAAGEFESGAGLATRAEILSVAVTEGRERSFYRTSEVMKAIDVAVRYAIRQKKPLAVNVSFGNSYGPHDGTGLLERYIDCVSSIWRLSIIVGMGNEGASDIHYAGKFEKQREGIAYYDTTKSQDILISVGEFERELIISLWKNFGDDMAVEIFSPNGDSTGIIYDVEMGNTGMNSNVTRISLSGTTGFVRYQTATPYTSKSEIYIELTKENGYELAGSYLNGETVESFGGGICQVSTTLYNALLKAELEITQRFNHSMTVAYVDLAADAAIAGTYKDLRFRNNYDFPIYIEGVCKNRNITFNIYGKETRDPNRVVTYVSQVVSVNDPLTEYTLLESVPVGTFRQTRGKHVGYVAELYKVVTVNGVETERTRVNKSTYQASCRKVTIGLGGANDAHRAAVHAAIATGDDGYVQGVVQTRMGM